MSKLAPLFPFLVIFPALPASWCPGQESATPPMYEDGGSLQETMLATRRNYAKWQVDQLSARETVELGPWWATPLLPSEGIDSQVTPTDGVPVEAVLAAGRAEWSQQQQLTDGRVVKFVSGSEAEAAYLMRSIRARRPTRLTVGIGGGDRLDAWLNGIKVASAATCLPLGRYGCATRVDGTRTDQLLVDLELREGTNTLVIRLTPGSEPSFYCSVTPHPVPRLWEQVRKDYVPGENPLLDAVDASWFEDDGWFAATDTAFEEAFVDQQMVHCVADRTIVSRKIVELKQPGVDHRDGGWLGLCVEVSILAELRRDLGRLRAAVSDLGSSCPEGYPLVEFLGRLSRFETRLSAQAVEGLDPCDETTRGLMEEIVQLQREMLVSENPLLQDCKLLFVKRYTYNSKHYYDDFQHISRWGGNLCAYSLSDGHVREIVPQLAGGVFDRYDLSFDARKIVFGYRRPQPEGYRIYEVDISGGNLRQVTRPPDDEADRIATYGKTSTGDGFYGLMGYRFWTDDVHPCYLPDGDFCFASTRSEHGVLCTPNHYLACTSLFRMRPDGSALRPISRGALSEFTPTMMEDGRVLYNRWEYVYKGIAAVQPLWTVRPDGSGSEEFFGDNITNPGVLWQARQVPGVPHLAVCIGCGHEPLGIGQVLLLDLRQDKRTSRPITSLTPHVKTENLRGLYQQRNGQWREDIFGPLYSDPYPLSDKFFLVSCNPDKRYNDQAAYGIYLIDRFGNRVLVYDDPEISCWQPMLIRARHVPPRLPAVEDDSPAGEPLATVFLSDVYRGLDGVDRGTVKYLRVMEQIPKPWAAEVDLLRREDRSADGFGGHIAVSHNAHIWVAVLRGIVPVQEDGSACMELPAGRNLFFQALDEHYMEVQRMRTFVNFEPGERRSCIGCHEHRSQAPVSRRAIALGLPPTKLAAQPGEVAPRPLHYPSDVQPVFDRHCVECHNGKDPQVPPDLRGELTTWFNRSYESVFEAGLVDTIREWAGATYAMQNAAAVPPYSHGSHRSKLVDLLRKGHHDVRLADEEWVKLVTWIDSGAPYYGSYFGRRHLRYRGQPDFRPVPTIESACGVRPAITVLPQRDRLQAELLAWWPFDESTADAVIDASRFERNTKVVNVPVCRGRIGQGARRFDGGGFLEAENLGSHEALSICLWVKTHSLGNRWNPLLFCHEGQPGAVHFSLLNDGTPNVAVNTGDWNWTHVNGRVSLGDGNWHHLALVADARFGGDATFYVDGQPAGHGFLGLGMQLDLYRFRIGGWNRWEGVAANNFHGEIDDVRIYNGMLTADQVVALAGQACPAAN